MTSSSSRKKNPIAYSTAKVEYIGANNSFQEVVWIRKLLVGLISEKLEIIVIEFDNKRCIKFSENPMFNDRSKHIEMKYHYIRDMVQRGVVRI